MYYVKMQMSVEARGGGRPWLPAADAAPQYLSSCRAHLLNTPSRLSLDHSHGYPVLFTSEEDQENSIRGCYRVSILAWSDYQSRPEGIGAVVTLFFFCDDSAPYRPELPGYEVMCRCLVKSLPHYGASLACNLALAAQGRLCRNQCTSQRRYDSVIDVVTGG